MGKFGRNTLVRTASGIALLAIVLACVFFSEFSFGVLMAVIGVGSLWEFYRIAVKSGAEPQKWYGAALGAIFIALGFLCAGGYLPLSALAAALPLGASVFVAELYRKKENPLFNVSATLGGLLYAALPAALICFIAFMGGVYNPYVILAYIFIVWVNDIFAYLAGVAFGRHRLFERISPKKSWEGFFGGVICAVAFAALCGHLLGDDLWFWGGLGLVVALTGVLGDLVESMFKRAVGVKDSGRIMPGHGGFMDRFDALILSAPFVFTYFIIFAN